MNQYTIIYDGEEYDAQGTSMADAIEKWADDYDCNSDYELVKKLNNAVECRDENGLTKKFDLVAESAIQYNAFEE